MLQRRPQAYTAVECFPALLQPYGAEPLRCEVSHVKVQSENRKPSSKSSPLQTQEYSKKKAFTPEAFARLG